MELLHPGVIIHEIPSGVRPIAGVSTSTTAFIGKAQKGLLNQAVLTTRLQEFEDNFGTFLNDSWLAHSVFQFFNNGGKKCYVVRMAGTGTAAAEITLKDRKAAATKTLVIRARARGGNSLDITITNGTLDPDNEFNLSVFRDRGTETPPLLLETFENLSMNSSAVNFVEKVIAANAKNVRVSVDAANLASALAGTSCSGKLLVGDGATRLGRSTLKAWCKRVAELPAYGAVLDL